MYYLNNFNDFASAFVTMFELMVVNNWHVVANMYYDVTDNKWVYVYFIVLFYFTAVIGMNMVIGFAIDMYNSIERLDLQHI